MRCVDISVQGTGASSLSLGHTYRLHCSSRSCGLNLGSYKVLPRKELEWSLWVGRLGLGFWGGGGGLASRRVPNVGLVGALGSAIWGHLESAVQGFSVNEVCSSMFRPFCVLQLPFRGRGGWGLHPCIHLGLH